MEKKVVKVRTRINTCTDDLGFSLFEMLIALVILSFVSLTIANSLNYVSKNKNLEQSIDNLVKHLKEVHLESRKSGSIEWVKFDLKNKTYFTSLRRKDFQLPVEAEIDILSAEEYSTDNKFSTIYFYGELGASGGIIKLRTKTKNKKIEIHSITGFVKSEE